MVIEKRERERNMKKQLFWAIAALAWGCMLLPANAAPLVAADQFIDCDANGYYYWAMIWDYTNGQRESATPGAVNTAYRLGYSLWSFGEVHVAYLYNWATGHYIEAQALRNVRL